MIIFICWYLLSWVLLRIIFFLLWPEEKMAGWRGVMLALIALGFATLAYIVPIALK